MDAAVEKLNEQLNDELDDARVKDEFPDEPGCLYLNTGSCGRKPQSVLRAIAQGWNDLNINPTLATFMNESFLLEAKAAVARLFEVPPENLLLVQNTTQGLHLILQSLLLNAGDEFVTTSSEHGSVNTIARYLSETRGIVVHTVNIDPLEGEDVFLAKMMAKVSSRTKCVLVSEISSYTTWRPDLTVLEHSLKSQNVPLLVDGAHAGGQIICRPGKYRLWVGSGHKWLGAPNGTGFIYAAPDLIPQLKPLWLGDEYFRLSEAHPNTLLPFESQGTSDVVRLQGLTAAVNLQLELGPESIYQRELELAQYLRRAVSDLNPNFRTPESPCNTAMFVMHWTDDKMPVPHLRDHLWNKYKIWVQPDFMNQNPGLGVRVSCHYALQKTDLDRFVQALRETLQNA